MPMTFARVRALEVRDVTTVATLNSAAVPAVNDLSTERLRDIIALCDLALVGADENDQVIAFLLSLTEGQPYDSENYGWFEDREKAHQYIDRVVVAPAAQGTGVGRALYERVVARARERGASEVTAEVNLEPPNPQSLAFHESMGFRRLGEQATKDGTVVVALLARPTTGP